MGFCGLAADKTLSPFLRSFSFGDSFLFVAFLVFVDEVSGFLETAPQVVEAEGFAGLVAASARESLKDRSSAPWRFTGTFSIFRSSLSGTP